ncbi:MAG: UDP-N-acetylmuramoyl-L-alanyl-D-glutamate--2,6-diaminopimelate ligase [Paenibacillus sp.]|jgi:UDP-N-acetylmuramoyl-L-alanyl-D-glutamate--2,6-diaminopimelate ligase|nr:UDP-N-acetylmuramoyl-L-alanyl-D-glutamate--2,6-diaminopimelate ligase [Paenibacillus sp.]
MQLRELASLLKLCKLEGDGTVEITGIQTDSRKVSPGDLFLCIPGLVHDGHDFASMAADRGAAALVVERPVPGSLPALHVKDARFAMAVLASHFYRYPSERMKLIGITGTNGKTTTSYILEQMLSDCGWRTGLMGTISIKIGNDWSEAVRTTQEALDLQHSLSRMAEVGTEACIMEVSSHALELGRVKGCRFRTAIFTNLTQDHLDFHGTMERYQKSKGLFFARMNNGYEEDPDRRQYVVLNGDDEASAVYKASTSAEVIQYGLGPALDVRAAHIRITSQGTLFRLITFAGETDVQMKLIGKFNVYNALAAVAAMLVEGFQLERIKESLERVRVVPGRMELVESANPNYAVVVDYAHTPDGLENALSTVKEFAEGRVITVFGCGGERDRTKRPLMGKIAAKYSDYVIVTSDNPRSEHPNSIISEIEQGIQTEESYPQFYSLEADRRKAIQMAIEMASPKDVVLIAGKGHETTQIINGTTIHFDDRLVAQEAIRGRNQ